LESTTKWFLPFALSANNKNCAVLFAGNAMKSIAFSAECRLAPKNGVPLVMTSLYLKIAIFNTFAMSVE